MGINFNSSSNYKLLINQANQLNVPKAQAQSSGNVDPTILLPPGGVNPDDVLSYMENFAVLNGVTTGDHSSNTVVDKQLMALQDKANKAKELADKPNIQLKATGAKTLSKEKACTKGRNMGSQAKELTTQYLDSQIKNQAKNAFLAKYTTVLKNAGYSTAQINNTFEVMYAGTKTQVATMAQNMDNRFVSYGNKGFLKNKGYVNVDTQKLVTVFTQSFNQKAATLVKNISQKANSALEEYKASKNNINENTGSSNTIDSVQGQQSNLQEFADSKCCADYNSASEWVRRNPKDIAYYMKVVDGQLYTMVCISYFNPNGSIGVEQLPILGQLSPDNIGSALAQVYPNVLGGNNIGGTLIQVNPNVLGGNNIGGTPAQVNPNVIGGINSNQGQQSNLQAMDDYEEIGGSFEDWVNSLEVWPKAGDTYIKDGVKYRISVSYSDGNYVYYTICDPSGQESNQKVKC